jgi:hypothetical protein
MSREGTLNLGGVDGESFFMHFLSFIFNNLREALKIYAICYLLFSKYFVYLRPGSMRFVKFAEILIFVGLGNRGMEVVGVWGYGGDRFPERVSFGGLFDYGTKYGWCEQ